MMRTLSSILALMYLCCGILLAGSDPYEEWSNRVNGPPKYRYYDKIRSMDRTHPRYRPSDDANIYWGRQYYGNKEPDLLEEYYLDKRILEMEGLQEEEVKRD